MVCVNTNTFLVNKMTEGDHPEIIPGKFVHNGSATDGAQLKYMKHAGYEIS